MPLHGLRSLFEELERPLRVGGATFSVSQEHGHIPLAGCHRRKPILLLQPGGISLESLFKIYGSAETVLITVAEIVCHGVIAKFKRLLVLVEKRKSVAQLQIAVGAILVSCRRKHILLFYALNRLVEISRNKSPLAIPFLLVKFCCKVFHCKK